MERTFTPGGRYRDAIDDERVREPDGIHLNDAGAEIAAGEVLAAVAARLRGLTVTRLLAAAGPARPRPGRRRRRGGRRAGGGRQPGGGHRAAPEARAGDREVEVDARTGRPSPEGLQVLRSRLRPGSPGDRVRPRHQRRPVPPGRAAHQPERRPLAGGRPLPGDLHPAPPAAQRRAGGRAERRDRPAGIERAERVGRRLARSDRGGPVADGAATACTPHPPATRSGRSWWRTRSRPATREPSEGARARAAPPSRSHAAQRRSRARST